MQFVNLTPHQINITDADGTTEVLSIEPEGSVARVATKRVPAEMIGPVQTFVVETGEIEGLPEPQNGTIFIVSGFVRAAIDGRPDVLSPGELVRDDAGRPVGCQGLTR